MTVAPIPWSGGVAGHLASTSALLDRLEPRVRAFTHLDRALLAQPPVAPAGPLAGMPIAVKEIIDVAGMPTTCGSRVLAGRIPDRDAESVARLRAAGALVLGMTTTTPFACGTTTVTDNPRAPGRTPGGSSAGSGAAVGAGYVPLALASQSQASTLRPASYCGAWGFKPSHGRLPRAGMHLLSDTLDDLGLIGASLDDLHAAFSVLAEDRPAPTPTPTPTPTPRSTAQLRIGRLRLDDGGLPTPATLAALDRLVARLSTRIPVAHGTPELVAVDAALAGSGTTCFDLFAGESARTLAAHRADGEPDQRLWEMCTHAAAIGATGLAAALTERERLRDRWRELARHHDVLLSLSTTGVAPVGHGSTGCRRMPATASLLGVPALSAPWLTVDGLPQGVQLLGFEGRDEELLAAASAIADALAPHEEES